MRKGAVQRLQAALDKLDAAVSLCQHHDAVTGTAKQAVTNDYALRLAAASAAVHKHIARLISAAVFTPHACASCMTRKAAAAADASELAERGLDAPTDAAPECAARAGGEGCGGRGVDEESVQQAASASVGKTASGGAGRKEPPDGVPRLWPCEQGNVSACALTVDASRSCESFAVVLFNSVAWPREENVRVRSHARWGATAMRVAGRVHHMHGNTRARKTWTLG